MSDPFQALADFYGIKNDPVIELRLRPEENYDLPKAKCIVYEPMSETEGRCRISPIEGLVCKSDCDFPEKCDELKRWKKIRK